MDGDFSIRNELDSVKRHEDPDAKQYTNSASANPFENLVDAFEREHAQKNQQQSYAPPVDSDARHWRYQAGVAAKLADKQSEIAHHAIKIATRSFGEQATTTPNYWKYVALITLAALVITIIIAWKSNLSLRLTRVGFDSE